MTSSYGLSRSVTGPREGAIFDQTTQTIITTLGEDRVGGSQSVGSGISLTIFNAASLANLSASKKTARAAEMDLSVSRRQTVFEVKQRYFILLQRMEQLELAKEQVSVSEESLRRNNTLYEIGSLHHFGRLRRRIPVGSFSRRTHRQGKRRCHRPLTARVFARTQSRR